MDSPSPHNCTSGFRKSRLWFKEIDMEEKKEMVNSPSHYNQGSIECIDAMVSAFGAYSAAEFCKINAFKYLWRLGHKDDEAQEIGKIKWYLDKYIELKDNPLPPAELLDDGTVVIKERECYPSQREDVNTIAELKKQGLTQRQIEDILRK